MKYVTVCLAILVGIMATSARAAETGHMVFEVYRGDSRIGTHRFDFRRSAEDRIEVEIAIDLEVGFGPITLYRYTHRNRTLWNGGRLERIDARTDDDGTDFTVRARHRDGALRVESSKSGTYTAPADTWPSTYWMGGTVRRTRLINTQTGALAEVAVAKSASEQLVTPVGDAPARRYRMSGDVDVTLWYDGADRLAKLAFDARGKRVTYRLVERKGFVPSSPLPPVRRAGS